VINFRPGPLYLRERTPVGLRSEQEDGWSSETACKFWRREKAVALPGPEPHIYGNLAPKNEVNEGGNMIGPCFCNQNCVLMTNKKSCTP
jgi:hypothetical protein